MTPALRWAVMIAILIFHNYEGQSHKTVSTNHNLSEEKGEPKWNETEVLPLTSLTARPNRLTPPVVVVLLNVLGCRLTY